MQKIHCSQPPSSLIIQAFTNIPQCRIQTPYAYKLPSASSLSSFALGCQISLWSSALVPGKPIPSKITPKWGIDGLFLVSLLGDRKTSHMCALSVFRSCGGTVNRVHDTSCSASHVPFLRVLKLRSSPHFQQTYVPSFITLEPMNIGMSHMSRTRKSCRNIRETSPCPPFLSHP